MSRQLAPEHWYPGALAGVESRIVALGANDRVRVVTAGPERGIPVLLIHGWGAWAYSFRHLLPLVAEAGMRGIALDLRGHGLSEKPEEPAAYSAEAMTLQVVRLLDALDLTSAVLVGQSMGGAVTLDLAESAPSRVRGMVLLAPVGVTRIRRISLARALRASRWIPGRVPRWSVRLQLYRVYGDLRRYAAEDVDQYWAPSQDRGYARAIFHLVDEFDWSRRSPQRFARLVGRMRVLLGERDRLVTPARAKAWLHMLPPEHVTVVKGCGHVIAEEAPQAVMEAIAAVVSSTR